MLLLVFLLLLLLLPLNGSDAAVKPADLMYPIGHRNLSNTDVMKWIPRVRGGPAAAGDEGEGDGAGGGGGAGGGADEGADEADAGGGEPPAKIART